jgi:hypothetical protein
MNAPIDWLLEGQPWVEYRARRDLLGQTENSPEVVAARQNMIIAPKIKELIGELGEWPGTVLKSHKSATHLLHKLAFAADLGLRAGDPGIDQVIENILDNLSPEGLPQVLVNIGQRYGGSGEDQMAWMLCDAPTTIYALVKFGLGDDPRVQTAVDYLADLIRENGWPCAVSPVVGKFRGPGRKSDPCPYANLVMLKVLSQLPARHNDETTKTGVGTILGLWEQRKERKPYLFGMGTDYAKLKAPLIWYDILHILTVLTQFPWALSDPHLREMVTIVKDKADAQGHFTPESVWRAWKNWDFGQKRIPSRWLTLIAWRIIASTEK